ncbi:MAG TPA: SPOR domain-containing protein [Sphingomicrobium sp.]|nr:SPOR domain-containing protein [Sphingomicrobium sp.]
MADAGVARDANRLPWLEPYRAPPRKASNRRTGVTAAIGAIGLAAIVTLLNRDMAPVPASDPVPEARVTLPAPADMQPQIVLPALKAADEPVAATSKPTMRRPARLPRRKIKAVPTSAAYREVMKHQAGETEEADAGASEAALAIAELPIPPDPPLPVVDPKARVVRGKTVQLGVYLSQAQAEAAWKSAVSDYTYLVTMPKSIEAISIRSKRFYRLQLGTPSKRHAKQLCTNLKSIGRACTVA